MVTYKMDVYASLAACRRDISFAAIADTLISRFLSHDTYLLRHFFMRINASSHAESHHILLLSLRC